MNTYMLVRVMSRLGTCSLAIKYDSHSKFIDIHEKYAMEQKSFLVV